MVVAIAALVVLWERKATRVFSIRVHIRLAVVGCGNRLW